MRQFRRLHVLGVIAVAVALLAPIGIRPAAASGLVPLSSYSIDDVSKAEGSGGGTTAFTFTVTKSPAETAGSVSYATAPGSAQAPADYATATGTLNFAPNETTKTLTVNVVADNLTEIDETFFVNLTPDISGTCTDCQGQGTIVNDDGTIPQIVVDNVAVTEGNTGTVNAVFTVSLDTASNNTVTVAYATADGTATTADTDYVTNSGTLTFAPGDTSKPVTVLVNGDTKDEADEFFYLRLSAATNAQISDAEGEGRINNDDTPPTLSIADLTVSESAGTATVPVTLSAPSGKTVKVKYSTVDGTATAGNDYTAKTDAELVFAPGTTTMNATVALLGDTIDEPDETFSVTLSAAENATILKGTGVVTLTDDDGEPTISIAGTTVTEADSTTVPAEFTVTLSNASGRTVTVDYATADGTATAGADYTAASGTVTFTPGQTSKKISVDVLGDLLDEPNETFTVTLANPSFATITAATATGTITDNDPTPTLSINDVSKVEGGPTTTTAFAFTVTLSAASGRAVTVAYSTADGTATAVSGDYIASADTISFAPGETTKTVTITVNGDSEHEANETFTVNLSAPTNATLAKSAGVGTITDDDPGPSMSISDATVTEGNSGTVTALFTVSLSAASGTTITVAYATADGTATAPSDYAAKTGTLTFNPGQTSKTIAVTVNGDTDPRSQRDLHGRALELDRRGVHPRRRGPRHHHQRRRPPRLRWPSTT